MRLRSAAAAAAAAALAVVVAGPAVAVQTDEFGLRVGDSNAAALVVAAGSGTVTHSVLVTNRTRAGLTVELAAVGVQRGADGVFSYGSPGAGLASSVRLAQQSVRLGPLDSARVPVTITAPSHVTAPAYAAVVGVADGPRSDQLTIRPRLAVLVELTGRAADVAPSRGHAGSRLGLGLLATGGACVLVAGAVAAVRRRRAAPTAEAPEPVMLGFADVLPAAPSHVRVPSLPAADDPVPATRHDESAAPPDVELVPAAEPALAAVAAPSSVDRLRGRRPTG